MKKALLRRFKTIYAYLRIWLGNGQGFFNDFKYPVLLAIALKVYFPTATLLQTGILVVGIIIALTLIGWFDLNYVRIYQKVAEITTAKYNPYFKRLERKI